MSNQMNEDCTYSGQADITFQQLHPTFNYHELAAGNGSQHQFPTQPSITNIVDQGSPNEFDTAFQFEIAAPIGSSVTTYHVDDDALRLSHEGTSILQSPVRDSTLDATSYSGYPQHIDPSYLSGYELGERDPQAQHVEGYEWHLSQENNASTGILSFSNAIVSNQGPPVEQEQGFATVHSLSTCDWLGCNTTHPSSSMLAHWTTIHLRPIGTFMKQQPPAQKHAFCLWNSCNRNFKRRTDLDRHVRSIHLGINCHCTVPGCDDNGGIGFRRPDKLSDHKKKAHGFM